MSSDRSSFLRNARAFIRNPLGIVGLFVALIYGTGVAVSGFSPDLSEGQRWVMIAFTVLFPFVVLFVFHNLVTRHHAKLYAPEDWRDERHVFGSQTIATRRQQQQQDLAELASALSEAEPGGEYRSSHGRAQPDRRDLVYLLREVNDLALMKVRDTFLGEVIPDVVIGDDDGVPVDAMVVHGNTYIVVEVKFIIDAATAVQKFNTAVQVFERTDRYFRTLQTKGLQVRVKFLFLGVLETLEGDHPLVAAELQAQIRKVVDRKVRYLLVGLDHLRKEYGLVSE